MADNTDNTTEKQTTDATGEIHAVTGAFGYSGGCIAGQLLEKGHKVITLTGSPHRPNPFGDRVKAFAFNFDQPGLLKKSLEGVSVLYNTYWVRFNHKHFNHADAVRNTVVLFRAARDAGVRRIVHISITNPSEDSPLEYFRCKAQLERELKECGVSYAILRPAVLFGKKDILVNNIAWALRRLPVFGVFGNGRYRLRPIHVDDLARLAVEQGENTDNCTIDAVGPETFTYRELVRTIGEIIGKKRLIMPVPRFIGIISSWIIGKLVKDVLLTGDEVKGLMGNALYVDSPAAGTTKLTDWARAHADTLGRNYHSELARRTPGQNTGGK